MLTNTRNRQIVWGDRDTVRGFADGRSVEWHKEVYNYTRRTGTLLLQSHLFVVIVFTGGRSGV